MKIKKEERKNLNGHGSCILWFTGLSGSGKSTITNYLEEHLFSLGVHSVILDGDNLRHGLNCDLGFSEEDRYENIRRISEVAKILNEIGLVVLVATISPLQRDRELSRSICGHDLYEIYVSCNMEECVKRDPKGLYRKAKKGEITNFTGIGSPYEPPLNPHLVLESDKKNVKDLVREVISFLNQNNIELEHL
ncbi:adenylylsulfate kinase [Paenibacillus pabuli]|uniref:Adenylyl-sulfate kinase n=2 Tax=Paenibacillus pabuli TaxID=1472 RepID=A0ABX9BEQ2_9BACL|nr:adenylylsulfate kinase [Paenibacillus pabuli]